MATPDGPTDYGDDERYWMPMQQKNDEELEFFTDLAIQETQRWIECVTKKAFKYPEDPLRSLSDGVLLCELLNCLKPGSVKRINRLSTAMAKLDNLSLFLEACKSAFGLRVEQLFSVSDLQVAADSDSNDSNSDELGTAASAKLDEERRLRSVAITVFWLARQIRGSYQGPDIDFSAFAALVAARPDVVPAGTNDLGSNGSAGDFDAATASRSEGSDFDHDLPRSSDCSWDGSDGRWSTQRQQQHHSLSSNPLHFVALKPATDLARAAEVVLRKTELAKSTAHTDSSGDEAHAMSEDWQGNLSSWKQRRRSKSTSLVQSSMDEQPVRPDSSHRLSKRSSAYTKYPIDDDDGDTNGDGSTEEHTLHPTEALGLSAEPGVDSADSSGQGQVTCLGPGKYKIRLEAVSSSPDGFGLTVKGGCDKLEPITVEFVTPGSPAQAVGLEEGDEIVEIDGEKACEKARGYCMTLINRAARSTGNLVVVVHKRRLHHHHHAGITTTEDYSPSPSSDESHSGSHGPSGQMPLEEYIDNDTGERTLCYRSCEEGPAAFTASPATPAAAGAAAAAAGEMPVVTGRAATFADSGGPTKTFTSVTELKLTGGSVAARQQQLARPPSASFGTKARGMHADPDERHRMEEWAQQQEELAQAQFDHDQELLRRKFEDDQRLVVEAEKRQQQKTGDIRGSGSKSGALSKLDLANVHDREAKERATKKLQELKQKYAPTNVSENALQRRSSQLLASVSPTNGGTSSTGGRSNRDDSIDERERELRKREDELRRMEEHLLQERERIAREQQRLQSLKDDDAPDRRDNALQMASGWELARSSKATPNFADVYKCFAETQPPKDLGSRDDPVQRVTRREVVELNRKPLQSSVDVAAKQSGVSPLSIASIGRHGSHDDIRSTGKEQKSAASAEDLAYSAVITKDDVLRVTRERARYASPPAGRDESASSRNGGVGSLSMRKSISGYDVREGHHAQNTAAQTHGTAAEASEVVSKSVDFRSSRAMFEQQCKVAETQWQQRQAEENQRRLLARRKSVSSTTAEPPRQQSPPAVPVGGTSVRQAKQKFSDHLPTESLATLATGVTQAQLERQKELERLKVTRERDEAAIAAADDGAAREKERRLREERLRELAAIRHLNQEYEREKESSVGVHSQSGHRRSFSGSSTGEEELHEAERTANGRQRPSLVSAPRVQGQDPSIAQLPPYATEQIPIMQSEQEVLRLQLERQRELEAMRRSREAHSGQDEALEELRRVQQQKALHLQRLERLKEASASQQQPITEVTDAFRSASPRDVYTSAQYAAAGSNAGKPSAALAPSSLQQQWKQEEMRRAGSAEQQWRQEEARRAADRLEYQRRVEEARRADDTEQQWQQGGARRASEQEQQRWPEEARREAELEQQRLQEEARRASELEQQRRQDEARRVAELEQQRRQDEARRVAELEQQRRKDEARRVAELEQQKRQDEARKFAELEQQRRLEEDRKLAELEQQRRQDEARRVAELEQQRRQDEARRIAELEQQRRQDEARRVAELEQQRRQEEARKFAELEQQRRLEEDRKLAELEEQRRQEEARRAAEIEHRRWQDEARRSGEMEQQRRQEEARRAADASRLQRPLGGWAMQPEPQWRNQSSQELHQTPYNSLPDQSVMPLAYRGLSSAMPPDNTKLQPNAERLDVTADRSGLLPLRAEQEYAYINRRVTPGGDPTLLPGVGGTQAYGAYYDPNGFLARRPPPAAASGWQMNEPMPNAYGLDGQGSPSEPEFREDMAHSNYAAYVPQQPLPPQAAGSEPVRSAAEVGKPGSLHSSSFHRQHDEDMVSVSAKQHCAYCGKELGKGAAMVIETLSLYYHVECFRCCVCHSRLSNGTTGADVRVRGQKLHCKNCYSNDEAGVKYSAV